MFIALIKFIHLLATLGLLGTALYCLFLTFHRKKIFRLNKVMLLLAGLAMLTGTLLVHPKHFTFHTHWIDAAYLLMISVGLVLLLLIFTQKKFLSRNIYFNRWVSLFIYSFLIVIFLIVIHDAVTKTTLLF